MRSVVIPKNAVPLVRSSMLDIEKMGDVKITLQDNECIIEGEGGKDWVAEQVVLAMSLGFPFPRASKLFNDEYFLEIIDLDLAFRRSEKGIERAKARIIGTEGKAKKIIEELSEAFVSVWEDKVAIIGRYNELRAAKEAVTRIMEGATHTAVYDYLERMKRKRD